MAAQLRVLSVFVYLKELRVKKGKNDEEGDMEDGDTDGDNHSDRDSDKFGNSIVHEVETKKPPDSHPTVDSLNEFDNYLTLSVATESAAVVST